MGGHNGRPCLACSDNTMAFPSLCFSSFSSWVLRLKTMSGRPWEDVGRSWSGGSGTATAGTLSRLAVRVPAGAGPDVPPAPIHTLEQVSFSPNQPSTSAANETSGTAHVRVQMPWAVWCCDETAMVVPLLALRSQLAHLSSGPKPDCQIPGPWPWSLCVPHTQDPLSAGLKVATAPVTWSHAFWPDPHVRSPDSSREVGGPQIFSQICTWCRPRLPTDRPTHLCRPQSDAKRTVSAGTCCHRNCTEAVRHPNGRMSKPLCTCPNWHR